MLMQTPVQRPAKLTYQEICLHPSLFSVRFFKVHFPDFVIFMNLLDVKEKTELSIAICVFLNNKNFSWGILLSFLESFKQLRADYS